MNLNEEKYKKYAIVREMLQTGEVVRKFDPAVAKDFAEGILRKKGLFLTGEGSSRIFPAKRMMDEAHRLGFEFPIFTEGATQALEYPLSSYAVFAASNSGKTKEVVRLFHKLQKESHDSFFGVAANAGTPVIDLAKKSHVLTCGKEDAVAATKSVVEQALFYDSLLFHLTKGSSKGFSDSGAVRQAGDLIEKTLGLPVDPAFTHALKTATKLYFAGRNNGVAEELTLKTNEITRKKSAFLEGTYAVHGIEETMEANEAVIIIDPFPDEEEKFSLCLEKGVGMKVVAIASRQTRFPTLVIPEGGRWRHYLELAAGWNVLLEIGLALGIDLDKPVRARKVGNEYVPG